MSTTLDPSAQVVVNILKEANGWLTAKNISRRAAAMGHYIHPRKIGEIASSLGGAINGSGEGYKLTSRSSRKDIFDGWRFSMRRALGTEVRARELIHYARQNQLLGARDDDDSLNQMRLELEKELQSGQSEPPKVVAPSSAYSDPEEDEDRSFTGPAPIVVREQQPKSFTIHLVVVVPELGADTDYFQKPYAACLTVEAADSLKGKEKASITEGRLFSFTDQAHGKEAPAIGSMIYCVMKNNCAEKLFTDKELAEQEADSSLASEVLPVEVVDA